MQMKLDKKADLSEIPRMQRRPQARLLEYYVGLKKDKKGIGAKVKPNSSIWVR